MKKILFATSEAVPFIKTGGLADVAGALPKCFDKNYFDIRVILPKYACMKQEWKDKMEYITHFYMDLGYKNCYVGIMQMEYDGIKFYFIDNEYYFSGPKPYDGVPWDLEKFAFFSKAVLSVLPVIGFRPDIIHCHDWQTGLVPVYLHDTFQQNEFFWGIKTIMTIDFVTKDGGSHTEAAAASTPIDPHTGVMQGKPNSAVLNYPDGVVLSDQAGKPLTIEGYADAYSDPVTKIEFSLDKGKTWTTLETPDNDPTCWTYWRLTYTPAEPGAYLLKIRATCTDSEGVEHVASRDTNFLFNVE